MTTVVAALNRAARHCSISTPASWAGATQKAHVELRDDFLPETIDHILDRMDMPSPIGKQTTITGDGSESYSLPADFRRMQRDPMAAYETTTLRRAGTPITTDGVWTHVNQIGGAGASRFFRVEGYPGTYTIKFEDDLATGNEVVVSYISNVWLASAGGAEQTEFMADDDVLYIPRRVVESGIVWRFRERRGLDFSTPLTQYEAELSRLSNDARNARTIDFGGVSDDVLVMRVPTPNYIPDS